RGMASEGVDPGRPTVSFSRASPATDACGGLAAVHLSRGRRPQVHQRPGAADARVLLPGAAVQPAPEVPLRPAILGRGAPLRYRCPFPPRGTAQAGPYP